MLHFFQKYFYFLQLVHEQTEAGTIKMCHDMISNTTLLMIIKPFATSLGHYMVNDMLQKCMHIA
jgi:hypothetical protein